MEDKRIPDIRANCTYTVEDRVVCIVNKSKSFDIDDARGAIRSLLWEGIDPAPQKFIYRDMTGQWGELVVKNGRFHDFGVLATQSKEDAIAAVQRSPKPSLVRRLLQRLTR